MSDRSVRFTETAREQVAREHTWWLENRDYRQLFETELGKAIHILTVLPGAGTPYTRAGIAGLRRLYVRRLGCHLYYTFDDDEVIVRAFWGARRERGPSLL